jgi:hypothetical protein
MQMMTILRVPLLLLLAAPNAGKDSGCQSDTTVTDETRPPGDPGANTGAAGRVNSAADEQTDPRTTRKPSR